MNRNIVIGALALAALGLLGYAFLSRDPAGGPTVSDVQTVRLYYYDEDKDRDASGNIQCSRQGLVPLEREIRSTEPLSDTINLLLKGDITLEERARGVSTEYPLAGMRLVLTTLDQEGVLTLTFEDPENRTGGGSCRVGILWFQIEATAMQFPEVASVRFIPEELFQP